VVRSLVSANKACRILEQWRTMNATICDSAQQIWGFNFEKANFSSVATTGESHAASLSVLHGWTGFQLQIDNCNFADATVDAALTQDQSTKGRSGGPGMVFDATPHATVGATGEGESHDPDGEGKSQSV
jgi:hypothetical protein